jgi:predicted Zn-dependent peptidase
VIRPILTCVLSLTGLCPLAPAQDLPTLKVGEHEFHRRQLGNGLRAVVVRGKGERVSVFMVVGAGKRHETPATTGLAHLTEHAMYAGTAKRGLGKHDRLIHAMGGESNAFTREDYTLFYDHNVPTAQLELVLEMEADRLRGLTFDEKSVLFERERLRREEARTWKPSDARQELLESHMFRVHNYGAGILDAEGHTLAPGLDVATVHAFYDRYYRPNNTAVVVVGDVDPQDTLDSIATAFDKLQNGPKLEPLPAEPDPTKPREKEIEVALARDRCNLVWLAPALGHADRPALTVLARLLSHETSADGSPIEARMGGRVDKDLFQVAATGPRAREELRQRMTKARDELFDPKQVAKAVKLLADEYVTLPLRARPYFSLGGTFGVFEVLGHAKHLSSYATRVRAVDAAALRAVARRYLDPERQFTLTFKSNGVAVKPLPRDLQKLSRAAEEANAAGDLGRAIAAYTRLLEAGPNKMFKVIYFASRGQIYVKMKDYDGAIRDYEAALRVIDYPAVKKLLREARELKAGGKTG